MSFENFSLNPTLLANIKAVGYLSPTQIQAQLIPMAMSGKDASGLSRTGTGKTAAFLIPTLHRLSELPSDRLALCLSPTRELAQQIEQEAERLSKDMNIGTVSVVGGMSPEGQIRALKNGARLVTGTPGRIIDLFKEKALDLAKVDVLVFDEADRMFDMGFIKDMKYILSKVNPKRQILLFSATMNFSVLNLIYEYGSTPEEVNVSLDQMTAEKIQQLLYHVGDNEKATSLIAVCRKHSPENGSVIVFVNYKERVPWVAELLRQNGFPAEGLSSLLRQDKRNKIIQGFKAGKFRALVATDVASRGLDVDDVSLVVNYHLPEEAATYVHRIGRTARAGRSGIAVALSSSEDSYNQIRIEEFLGNKIPVEWLNDEDMPKDVKIPGRVYEKDEDDEMENQGDRPAAPAREHRPRGDRPARGPRPEGFQPRTTADRGPRPERGPRREQRTDSAIVGADRGPRPERADRNERGPRRDNRNDRGPRRDSRDSQARPPIAAPADLPSPVTGNPVIYDMKTGKPKNRSDQEYKQFLTDYQSRVHPVSAKSSGKKKAAPAIIKKISSKVTALFGTKATK